MSQLLKFYKDSCEDSLNLVEITITRPSVLMEEDIVDYRLSEFGDIEKKIFQIPKLVSPLMCLF